jgi:ABC-type nickel/cobalt efflux system permease component RcnA
MDTSFTLTGVLPLLGLGLVFGLKHATEVDHVVAISTIVSQNRNLLRSATVGALWGIGHSAALMITGIVVLSLRVAIPAKVSHWMEFGVAVMILGLGTSALWRALRKRTEVHLHEHSHDNVAHVHVHFHEPTTRHSKSKESAHSHSVSAVGLKPVLIGTMHGLAGSGPLTLLVLTQITSSWLGLLYLSLFGVGAIFGMLLMSGLVGLPFALSSRSLSGFHRHLQTAAAVLSIAFGLWYARESFSAAGLF